LLGHLYNCKLLKHHHDLISLSLDFQYQGTDFNYILALEHCKF